MPRIEDWRNSQCPSRGPGLAHAHWNKCNPSGVHPEGAPGDKFVGRQHTWDQCCHCEGRPSEVTDLVPVDVAKRLHDMGLGAKPAEHMDDDLVEPKSITGNGPQGSPWRHGRSRDGKGSLSEADKGRLEFHIDYLRRPAVIEGQAYLDGVLDPPPVGQ